jgi:hypothetical protein
VKVEPKKETASPLIQEIDTPKPTKKETKKEEPKKVEAKKEEPKKEEAKKEEPKKEQTSPYAANSKFNDYAKFDNKKADVAAGKGDDIKSLEEQIKELEDRQRQLEKETEQAKEEVNRAEAVKIEAVADLDKVQKEKEEVGKRVDTSLEGAKDCLDDLDIEMRDKMGLP